MRKDVAAQITIRDLNKLNKREVRSLVSWLRSKARVLESAVEPSELWLVTRKEFAGLFHYRLMK
jgi:hypothetical protein